MRRKLSALLCCCLFACAPDDQETGSVSKDDVLEARSKLPAAVRMHVDSGNALYRAKDYRRASEHYRAATAIDDDQVAAWFGVYMAERALGNVAAADAALKRAQKVAPGASLIRPDGSSDPGKKP